MSHSHLVVASVGYVVMAVVTFCFMAERDGRNDIYIPLTILPLALFWPMTLIGLVVGNLLKIISLAFVGLYNCCYEHGRRNGSK